MNPTGKSVSVSFRVRVVRACERARRSCVGVRGDVLLNAGVSNGKMSSPAAGLGFHCLLLYARALSKNLTV